MRALSIERMDMVIGGDLLVDVASGMMCDRFCSCSSFIGIYILTGGIGVISVLWGMGTAAVGCSLFAASVGR